MSKSGFRQYVPAMGTALHYGHTPESFLESLSQERRERRARKLAPLLAQPFKGITSDGEIVPGLFELRDEDAPTEAILAAVKTLLAALTPEESGAIVNPIDAPGRHRWVNGIPRYETFGIWLDDMTPEARDAALGVVRASLSAAGYEKSRIIMKLNGFLGRLVGAPRLLGEFCYQLHFFGTPSPSEPWGWQLFGHHLCLTCLVVGRQMTLTPAFMGAEPRFMDEGPEAGLVAFEEEERIGLALVRSLSADQRRRAIVYDTTLPGGLPPGRHQGSDGMMFGGYYRDNVVVPYEGISGDALDPGQRRALLELIECHLSPLPEGPLRARMDDIERHFAQTHFCWAGGIEDDSVFYYRIHSPVVMIEFDHHQGVVLNNKEPQRFHTHTIVRTPNGNDYGTDFLRLHYETAAHHRHPDGHDESVPGQL